MTKRNRAASAPRPRARGRFLPARSAGAAPSPTSVLGPASSFDLPATMLDCTIDQSENRVQLCGDIGRENANHPVARFLKQQVLASIAAIRDLVLKVPIAVDFDSDSQRFAREVDLGGSALEAERELLIQGEQISSPWAPLQCAVEAELCSRARELFVVQNNDRARRGRARRRARRLAAGGAPRTAGVVLRQCARRSSRRASRGGAR